MVHTPLPHRKSPNSSRIRHELHIISPSCTRPSNLALVQAKLCVQFLCTFLCKLQLTPDSWRPTPDPGFGKAFLSGGILHFRLLEGRQDHSLARPAGRRMDVNGKITPGFDATTSPVVTVIQCPNEPASVPRRRSANTTRTRIEAVGGRSLQVTPADRSIRWFVTGDADNRSQPRQRRQVDDQQRCNAGNADCQTVSGNACQRGSD